MPNYTHEYRKLCEQLLDFIHRHPSGWSHQLEFETELDRLKDVYEGLLELEEEEAENEYQEYQEFLATQRAETLSESSASKTEPSMPDNPVFNPVLLKQAWASLATRMFAIEDCMKKLNEYESEVTSRSDNPWVDLANHPDFQAIYDYVYELDLAGVPRDAKDKRRFGVSEDFYNILNKTGIGHKFHGLDIFVKDQS